MKTLLFSLALAQTTNRERPDLTMLFERDYTTPKEAIAKFPLISKDKGENMFLAGKGYGTVKCKVNNMKMRCCGKKEKKKVE